MQERKRDDQGKFVKSSDSLGDAIPVRLLVGDRERLKAIANKRGKPVTVLAREILSTWLRENEIEVVEQK